MIALFSFAVTMVTRDRKEVDLLQSSAGQKPEEVITGYRRSCLCVFVRACVLVVCGNIAQLWKLPQLNLLSWISLVSEVVW